MDTNARWSEGMGVVEEKKTLIRAQNKPKALNCPRCNSSHTKFCYYNNYNLSQPRYFCKTCRRYWTAGGTLRNVPVGGASRKTNKSSNIINHQLHDQPLLSSPNLVSQNQHTIIPNSSSTHEDHHQDNHQQLMGFFKSAAAAAGNHHDYASRGMMMIMNSYNPSNTIMMMNNTTSLDNDDHHRNNNNNVNITRADHSTTTTTPSTSARLFFPFEDLKPTSQTDQLQGDSSNCNAYWNGGGSW